ncbi:hypothetical protein ACLESO_52850 [Pyxidicoccus sp. 3LG]
MTTWKVRRTLTTAVLALGLALMGCGDVLGEEAEDEVMLEVEGSFVASSALDEARAKKLRAALLWERYPEGTVECLRTLPPDGNPRTCMSLTTPYEHTRYAVDVKVHSRTPTSVRLPVNKLPPAQALNGRPGSRMGFATMVLYVDNNDNGRLDTVGATATSSVDTVIGAQEDFVGMPNALYWIVYREGARHPLSRLLDGCPEAPPGYSVATYLYSDTPNEEGEYPVTCVMQRGRFSMNMVMDPNPPGFEQIACEEAYSFKRPQRAPATAPPAGTTSRCTTVQEAEGESLMVNSHPELFCTYANSTQYALVDIYTGQWDDRANPPAWWPCEVTPPSAP